MRVHLRRSLPTAPFAAAALIGGYGVAVASGSRPLGGAVLAALGAVCIGISRSRDPVSVTVVLTVLALAAFGVSHLLAEAVGAWPAVVVCALAVAAACTLLSDRPAARGRRGHGVARDAGLHVQSRG